MRSSIVKYRLVAGALLALASAAQSQVYRSVGPDGKITFTDKPPTVESAHARPPQVPAPAPPTTSTGALEPGRAPGPAGAAKAGVPAEPRGLEQSLRAVIGEADLVESFRFRCGVDFPEDQPQHGKAADEWQTRNRALVQRAFDVAGEQSGADGRMRLRMQVAKAVQASVDRIARASAPVKRQWCEDRLRDLAPGGRGDQAVQAGSAGLIGEQRKAR